MDPFNFVQMFFYFLFLLYIVTRWCVCSVDIFTNVGSSSAIHNPTKTNYKDMYSFNFPKEGVFVFKNPTIINLGDGYDIKANPKEDKMKHGTLNTSKPILLCKIFKVNYAYVILNSMILHIKDML